MSRIRPRTAVISGVAAMALVGGGTAAGAAISGGPIDASGVIHGCWTNAALKGTHIFVLQDAGTTCPQGTTAISWNQQGQAGPAGNTGPAGPAGAAGAPGPAGAAGAPGLAGQDGNTVFNGTGAPAASVGKDGDFYIDTAADVLYGPKASGTWPNTGTSLVGPPGNTGPAGPAGPAGPKGDQGTAGPAGNTGPAGPAGAAGAPGPAGQDGNTVLNGTGPPIPSVGKDGDFYIDTSDDVLYGPKNGAWPVSGVSPGTSKMDYGVLAIQIGGVPCDLTEAGGLDASTMTTFEGADGCYISGLSNMGQSPVPIVLPMHSSPPAGIPVLPGNGKFEVSGGGYYSFMILPQP
jgi:hypothetical protein